MKLFITTVVFWSFGLTANAQICAANINGIFIDTCLINAVVHKVPSGYKNVKGLMKKMNSCCTTEQEKAYFIYTYMGTHFFYDQGRADLIGKKKVKRELYTNELMGKRKGVCGDFSNLFKLLCDSAQVKCLRVNGYTSGGIFFKTPEESSFDHAWNIISINGKWYNVDVTWAIGIDGSPKKQRNISYNYLFAKEDEFSLTHLAGDPVYQLSSNKKTFSEFRWRQKEFQLVHDSITDDLINKRYALPEKDRYFTELQSQLSFSKAPEIEIFSNAIHKINSLTDSKNPLVKRVKVQHYEDAISWYKDLGMFADELKSRDQKKLEFTIEKEIKDFEKKIAKLSKKKKN